MATQKCPSDGITAFPLTLTSRPTLDNYQGVMEVITMDFQWGPLTTGLPPDKSSNNYILLQTNDTTSSVLYKSTRYTVDSVQIAKATHSMWLLTDPATGAATTNKEDLIITLVSTDSKSHDSYIIIVVPIIRGGSAASDPAYITNIGNTSTSQYDLGSCLPAKTGPDTGNVVFAMYSTCINGYTDRSDTQNVYVLVSTSGIQVSDAKMNTIINGITLTDSIRKPLTFSHMSGSRTSIDVLDFQKYISATRYLTDITVEASVEKRTDSTNQYKCMELDPDSQIDANGNMSIDMNTGDVSSSTLTDIANERKILKEMVAPTAADSATKRMVGTIFEYVIAFIVILCIIAGVYVSFYTKGDWKNFGMGIGMCLLFIIATSLGLAGYKTNNTSLYTISYIFVGLGFAALLIWFPIWYNTPAVVAATPLTAAAAGAGATSVAAPTTPAAGFDMAALIQKIPVYGVIACISLLGGFVIGSLY